MATRFQESKTSHHAPLFPAGMTAVNGILLQTVSKFVHSAFGFMYSGMNSRPAIRGVTMDES